MSGDEDLKTVCRFFLWFVALFLAYMSFSHWLVYKKTDRDWDLNFNLGNVVKYVSRNGRKPNESSLKDLEKARQYLDFEIAAIKEYGPESGFKGV